MRLLVHPDRAWDEGPSGYRYRLATANMLRYADLTSLEETGELTTTIYGHEQFGLGVGKFDPWVRLRSRFCPACLQSRGIWHVGWELLFADACPICGNWLVDRCSTCGADLNWYRSHIHKCDCGRFLITEPHTSAPPALLRLSRSLQDVALGLPPSDLPAFDGMRLEQCGRLIRLLGGYGSGIGGRFSQKIGQLDTLNISWSITTMAAEILDTWPSGFYLLLENLQHQNGPSSHGKLTTAFRGFYSSLYRGFKDPEFQALRTEFENYLSQNWTGAIGKRNRRLTEATVETAAWIPASYACRVLSVSRSRLIKLIVDGQLQGEQRFTEKGRRFVVVLRSDVERLVSTLDNGVTLVDAANKLGISKQRLLALLPTICPKAKRLGAQGSPWAIPSHWVATWEHFIQQQLLVEHVDADSVTLGHVLSYWPWTNDQISDLLLAISLGTFSVARAQKSADGISSLVLSVNKLHHWFSARQNVPCAEFKIPELAIRMGVKQEVAYSLVRSSLIPSVLRKVGRRNEQRVKAIALEQFERSFVFGRDLAKSLGRSPRSVAEFLLSGGVQAVAGPGVDDCRQLVFRRDDVNRLLSRHGITLCGIRGSRT